VGGRVTLCMWARVGSSLRVRHCETTVLAVR